ncbi:MAG: hypothetical protein KKF46_03690 [Nanoarchaeota archaeon]|nr:hypothetical protein [Nanoarchaeota archaeon]MBU1321438.1 hypothetical protein [Nanoarchaeota archaeon]MBU1597064.1 hypothetical protein [Nanoarchaeota archaeon]MBU2440854.1 hypothetical protein [Nanoarchaeota archaeon]
MSVEHCVKCDAKLHPTKLKISGIEFEGLRCIKCGEKVFTEKQMNAVAAALEQKRLKGEYKKHPIKIGHSYGMIFPKDIVQVFNLDAKGTQLGIKADKARHKIEITVL